MPGSWWRSFSATASAAPRAMAASRGFRSRAVLGIRTRLPTTDGASLEKLTSTSSCPDMARNVAAVARLKISTGVSLSCMRPSGRSGADAGLRQFGAEAALVIFRDDRPLQLVALVEERDPEGEGDIVEDRPILRPGDHGARRHDGRDVAGQQALTRQVGDADHGVDQL